MHEGFENSFMDMSREELHSHVVKYTRELKKLELDKKEFVSGVRDAVKELNERVDLILGILKNK